MASGVDPLVRVTVARADGSTFPALSRRSGARIELLPVEGALPPLALDDELGLKRPVAGDATYEEPVVVRSVDDEVVLVEPAGERRRHQQRDHVRVPTLALQMHLTEIPPAGPAGESPDGQDDDGTAATASRQVRLVDLSAGGARVEHDGEPLTPGSRWRVEVELPFDDGSTLDIAHDAEVRWQTSVAEVDSLPDPADDAGAGDDDWPHLDGPPPTTAGLRFLGVRPGTEESITRWVFQQQAKWLRVRRDDRRA